MEQRRQITLASRIRAHPIRKKQKTRNQRAQNKPATTKKGKRRPGKTVKPVLSRSLQNRLRKKPARPKQLENLKKPASKKNRSPK
jgi:hypothetical protein